MSQILARNWKATVACCVISMAVLIVAAFFLQLWVLTAIPIGLLFGFFLQKGDLCGSAAFSEVIVFRDGRRLFGIWVVIVVSMAGFALLDLLGWVKLNPKPCLWLAQILGGAIFGVGTVFAGGCVSGSLYKAGVGHLNSMVALVAIPLGVSLVATGPLSPIAGQLKKGFAIKGVDGQAVALPSVTGLPYWGLALIFVVATLAPVVLFRRRLSSNQPTAPSEGMPRLERIATRQWKPWQAGVAIGLLAMVAYLSSAASGRNYPLGVTKGVWGAMSLVVERDFKHVWQPPAKAADRETTAKASASPAEPKKEAAVTKPSKKIVWWLVLFVTGLVLGSWVSASLSGRARLMAKPPDQILFALLGGLMVGAGANLGAGCIVGNVISGWALMSVGSILFGVVAMLSNWVAAYFYLLGGPSSGVRQPPTERSV